MFRIRLLLLLLSFSCWFLSIDQASSQSSAFAANEVIVKFSNPHSNARTNLKNQFAIGKSTSLSSPKKELWNVAFPIQLNNKTIGNLEELTVHLSQLPGVEYAEPNYYYYLNSDTINDPYYPTLWALNNLGQTGGFEDADIDAPEAWKTNQDGPEVKIGILDTGIDWTHPDLVQNIWQNYGEDIDRDGRVIEWNGTNWVFDPDDENGIDDDNNGYIDDFIGWDFVNGDNNPMDGHGHGTHCAGIIGAESNNHIGITGVSNKVKLIALKVFGDNGTNATTADIDLALQYADEAGVLLTNNSWGGGPESAALEAAISLQETNGRLFVAAAGNRNGGNNDALPYFPCSYPLDNIICVGSSNHFDQIAAYSNFGETSVDLFAPGDSMFSTLPNAVYSYKGGTSAATAIASGALATVGSKFPSLDYVSLKNQLLSTVDQKNEFYGRCLSNGRLNLWNAVYDELPQADFSSIKNGLSVSFDITYPWNGNTYLWDFGDGNLAEGPSPSHSYLQAGVYQVCVTAVNNYGIDTLCYYQGISDSADCLVADSLELVAFYYATNGEDWTNSWDLNTRVSTWFGVSIDNCKVTCIDLDGVSGCTEQITTGNNLNGKLNDLNLPELRYLYLAGNELNGRIPSFSNLPNILSINLANNYLSGTIPNLNNSFIPNLENLEIQNNQFDFNDFDQHIDSNLGISTFSYAPQDSIPILIKDGRLQVLGAETTEHTSYFWYRDNVLIGNTLDENTFLPVNDGIYHCQVQNSRITGASQPRNLTLVTNKINFSMADHCLKSDSLTLVDFYHAMDGPNWTTPWVLSKSVHLWEGVSLGNCQVVKLVLKNNQLTGTLFDLALPALTQLDLSDNPIRGTIPTFQNLPNLAILDLENTAVKGNVPDFCHLPLLNDLDLSNNHLTFTELAGSPGNVDCISNFIYAPQDSMSTLIENDTIYVNAGGRVNQNTYNWWNNGAVVATIQGDSTHTPAASGYFHCTIENDQITLPQSGQNLVLTSKPILFCKANPSFLADISGMCSGSAATFINQSTFANDFEWYINDSMVATTLNLTYSFQEHGAFKVELIANDGFCSNSFVRQFHVKQGAEELDLPAEQLLCNCGGLVHSGLEEMAGYEWWNSGNLLGSTDTLEITESGIYTLFVIDMCGNVAVDSMEVIVEADDCVWPGDFNFDGTVNFKDYLVLGPAIRENLSGSARTNPTTQWAPQLSMDWNTSTYYGVDHKHVDGDGNGVIDTTDANVVLSNYGKTRPPDLEIDSCGQNFTAPSISSHLKMLNSNYVIVPYPYLSPTDTTKLIIDMNIEDINGDSVDIFGFYFEMEYDEKDAIADFSNSVLGINNVDMITGSHDYSEESLEIVASLHEGQNRKVKGPVCSAVVTIQDLPNGGNGALQINAPISILETGETVEITSDVMTYKVNSVESFVPGTTSTTSQDNLKFFINASPFVCDRFTRATVTVLDGGVPPYSYQWSNGVVSRTTYRLGSGTHYVTITDAVGESQVGSINVGENENFQVQLTVGADDVISTAIVTAVDGPAIQDYMWENGQTSETVTGLQSGFHNLTVTSDNCTDVISFYLDEDQLIVKPIAFLGGPYETATGKMRDFLREENLIPIISPYNNSNKIDARVLNIKGNNAIVDWVQVELRDAQDTSVHRMVADALIQRDGDIVALDGVSALKMENLVPAYYHVVLKHRNHLPVMTLTPVLLNASLNSIVDLRTNLLLPGDTNADRFIDASDRSGSWNDRNNAGYLPTDINLDGKVDAADRSSTWNFRNRSW